MLSLTLSPTYELVTLDGVRARTWTGTTDTGLPVRVYVLRIEPLGGTPEQRQTLAAALIRGAYPASVQPILPGPPRPGAAAAPPSRRVTP